MYQHLLLIFVTVWSEDPKANAAPFHQWLQRSPQRGGSVMISDLCVKQMIRKSMTTLTMPRQVMIMMKIMKMRWWFIDRRCARCQYAIHCFHSKNDTKCVYRVSRLSTGGRLYESSTFVFHPKPCVAAKTCGLHVASTRIHWRSYFWEWKLCTHSYKFMETAWLKIKESSKEDRDSSTAHTYIHTYIHTSIHTYIHTSMHPCIHACIHAYMHTCIHAYMVPPPLAGKNWVYFAFCPKLLFQARCWKCCHNSTTTTISFSATLLIPHRFSMTLQSRLHNHLVLAWFLPESWSFFHPAGFPAHPIPHHPQSSPPC